jgi:hypothetical protein
VRRLAGPTGDERPCKLGLCSTAESRAAMPTEPLAEVLSFRPAEEPKTTPARSRTSDRAVETVHSPEETIVRYCIGKVIAVR